MNITKMCYSVEPRDRRYVKGYGFLSFAKNTGKNISSKGSQKLVDSAEKSATDAIKTASKRTIQKAAKGTGDLIGNKIEELSSNEANNGIPKERYISPQERHQIIDELRLL